LPITVAMLAEPGGALSASATLDGSRINPRYS
jgi:hypothetical protein